MFSATFEPGSDGNLVQEFVAMEQIMHAQHTSAMADGGAANATHQSYVCAVDIQPVLECLDIAAASTARDQYKSGFDTAYRTYAHELLGNVISHSDAMYIVGNSDMIASTSTQLYGFAAECSWTTTLKSGDGAITAMDSWVLLASQFRLGPYVSIAESPTDVATVVPRPNTGKRCMDETPPPRLLWNLNIIEDVCYDTGKSGLVGRSSWHNTRVLQPYVPHINVATPLSVSKTTADQPSPTWSPFNLPSDGVVMTPPPPPLTTVNPPAHNSANSANSLDASIARFGGTAHGEWFWINIPGLHAVVDITLLGVDNGEGVSLSNQPAPSFGSDEEPLRTSLYELRFIRHREFYELPTHACATVSSARGGVQAMEGGVVGIAQFTDGEKALCGFDLVLWKPAHTNPYTSDCSVAIAAGSTSMNGALGAVQRVTICPPVVFHKTDGATGPSSSPRPPASPLAPPTHGAPHPAAPLSRNATFHRSNNAATSSDDDATAVIFFVILVVLVVVAIMASYRYCDFWGTNEQLYSQPLLRKDAQSCGTPMGDAQKGCINAMLPYHNAMASVVIDPHMLRHTKRSHTLTYR